MSVRLAERTTQQILLEIPALQVVWPRARRSYRAAPIFPSTYTPNIPTRFASVFDSSGSRDSRLVAHAEFLVSVDVFIDFSISLIKKGDGGGKLYSQPRRRRFVCWMKLFSFILIFSWFIFQYFFFVFLWFFCLVSQDVWNALLLFRVGLIHSLQFLQCWSLDSCSYLFSSQKQPPSLFTLSRFYNFLSSFLVLLFF